MGLTDSTWSTDANWNGAAAPGAVTGVVSLDTATFLDAVNLGVTVDAYRNIQNILFDTASAGAFTLSGGQLVVTTGGAVTINGTVVNTETINSNILLSSATSATLSLLNNSTTAAAQLVIGGSIAGQAVAANTDTVTVGGTNGGTVSGVIGDGSGGGNVAVAKTGVGVWTLSGANAYTGVTTITAGTLSTGAAGTLANGGVASSIGQAGNAAANLVLNGGTLQYASTGAATTTDRLFTLTNLGGTIDASGTNPVTFAGNGVGAANAIAFTGAGIRTFTLTGTNTGANSFNLQIGDLAAATPTSFTKSGTGKWLLPVANTFTGTTLINAGTLVTGNARSLGSSRVNVANGATLDLNGQNLNVDFLNNVGTLTGGVVDNVSAGGSVTLFVGGNAGGVNSASGTYQANDTFSGVIKNTTGTVNLTKVSPLVANQTAGIMASASLMNGPNVLRLTNQNTYTGTTTIKGGIIELSFNIANNGGAAVNTNILPATSTLELAGGDLLQVGTTSTQTVAGVTLNAGASHVGAYRNTSSSANLTLNAITRIAGGTLDLMNRPSGTNSNAKLGAADGTSIKTSTGNANFAGGSATILGGYATWNGNTWAVSAGTGAANGNLSALGTFTAFLAAGNVDATVGASTPGPLTINSLRFNTAGAYTVSTAGDLTIATGGILVTTGVGANAVAINNSNLSSNNGQDLIVIQNNGAGAMSIGSNMIGSIGLTKSGIGSLTLAPNTANTFTGPLTINAGAVTLGNANALNSNGTTFNDVVFAGTSQTLGGANPSFLFTNGTLNLNGNNATVASLTSSSDSSGTAVVQNASGTAATITVNGTTSTTFAGNIQDGTGSAALGLTKAGSSTLTLLNNSYTGNTTVTGGTLVVKKSLTSPTVAVNNGTTLDLSAVAGGLVLASGQTLTGGGTVNGPVSLATGAVLTPGTNGIGALTTGALTISAGSTLNYQFDGTTSDLTAVTNLTLGSGITLNLYNLAGTAFTAGIGNTYNLLTYSGTLTGTAPATAFTVGNGVGFNYTFGTAGNTITLTITGTAALDATWNNTTGGSWGTGPWTGGNAPTNAGETAHFAGAITTPATVTLDGNHSVGTLELNNSANAYTIAQGTGGTLSFDNSASSASLTVTAGTHAITAPIALLSNTVASVVQAGDALTASGGISGAGALTKAGLGSLNLPTANSFTGGTNLNGGTVNFVSGGLGTTGPITFGGATLQYAIGNTDDLSTRTVTLAGPALIDTGSNAVVYANPIGNAGAGGVTKLGSGSLSLAAGNTFTGGNVIKAGTLIIAADTSLGAVPAAAATNLTFSPGAGNSATLQAAAAMTLAANRNVALVNGTAIFDTNSNNVTVAGNISGSGLFRKASAGVLTLTGTNNVTATGGATIDAGTVALFTNANLPSGLLTLNGTAGVTTTAVSGFGPVLVNGTNFITSSSNSTIQSLGQTTGAGTLTFGGGFVNDLTGDLTAFTGTIIPNKVGFRFNGTAGGTNLTLDLQNLGGSQRAGAAMTIGQLLGTGGVLNGSAGGNTAAVTFTIGGKTVSGNPVDSNFAGSITNGAAATSLVKVGASTLILAGSSSYTGVTTISAGTLQLGDGTVGRDGTIATSTSIVNNAALVYNRFGSPTYSGIISGTGTVTMKGTGSQALTGANTYTGTTTISGGVLSTGASGSLSNGGIPGTIGATSNAAANLVLDGGTLQYANTGAAQSTDRLFTLTANGGGLDASGANAVTFAGNGLGAANAIAFTGSGARTMTLTGSSVAANILGMLLGDGSGGATSLTKTGTGSWTLANANTYSGGTIISGGILNASNISGSATGTGSVSAATGGTLQGTGAISGPVTVDGGTVGGGTPGTVLTLNGLTYNSGILSSALDANAVTSSVIAATNTTFTAIPTFAFNFANVGAIANGQTYTLLTSVNPIVDGGFLTGLPTTALGRITLAPSKSGANAIVVTVNGSTANLVWAGGVAGLPGGTSGDGSTWDNTLTPTLSGNWNHSGSRDYYYDYDSVTFNDTGAPVHTINLGADNIIGSVTVNTVTGYTFAGTGSMKGGGNLTLAGGALTLNTINTYTGGTRINAGTTLTEGVAGALPASGTVAVAGTLDLNGFNQTIGALSDGAVSSGVVTSGLAGAVTLTAGAAASTTYSGIIQNGAGAVALTKSGAGKLTLTGANTYSGVTSINGGVLAINASGSLGDGSATNAIALSGGTLESTGNTYDLGVNRAITLTAAGTIQTDAGTLTISGAVTNGANLLTVAGAGNTMISGVIGNGAGGLTKVGNGTLTLSGVNTYTGTTTINGGTVSIANLNNTGAGGITLNGGTLLTTATTLAATTDTTKAITVGANGGTLSLAPFVGPANVQLWLNAANLLVGSGPLTVVSNTGNGIGNVRINQTNTYNGAITLQNGGNFEYGVTGAVTGTATTGATFTINGGGELDVNIGVTVPLAITVNGGVISFEGGATGIYSGPITLAAAGGTVGMRNWYNQATTGGSITGVISGIGNLTIGTTDTTVSGAATISGANTYTGDTIIASGTVNAASIVVASGASNLGNSANPVTLGSNTLGATLNYTGAAVSYTRGFTIGAGGGQLINAGTGLLSIDSGGIGGTGGFTVNGATGKDVAISSVISNGGGLTKTGADNLTLSGANTYAGATTVSGGTLTAGVISVPNLSGAFGKNSAVSLANAAGVGLNITGFNTQIGSLTGGGAIGGNVTLGAATLTLGGDNTSPAPYGGVISGTGGGLTKIGTGTETLSGANIYTGSTVVSGGTLKISGSISGTTAVTVTNGTLELAATNAVNAGAPITLGDNLGNAGGVLKITDGLTATVETLGTLTLSYSSVLDFGSGSGDSLIFAGIGAHSPGGPRLTIANWDGTLLTQGTDGVNDRLIVVGDATALTNFNNSFAQGDLSFNGIGGYATFQIDATHFEIVGIPEPSSIALLGSMTLFGMAGLRMRCARPAR